MKSYLVRMLYLCDMRILHCPGSKSSEKPVKTSSTRVKPYEMDYFPKKAKSAL